MRSLWMLVLAGAVLVPGSLRGQEPVTVKWIGHVDDASLAAPGFFGKLLRVVGGSDEGLMLGLPFAVDVSKTHYLVLDRESNGLVAIDRGSRKARRIKLDHAQIRSPVDVAGEPDLYYVSDSELGRVFVGRGDRLEPFLDTAHGLQRPTGLALDPSAKRLWVVDTDRHQLLCFSLEGALLDVWGERGSADSTFNYPTFVAVCRDGSVVVNDTMNGKIKKFRRDGGLQWSVGGFDTTVTRFGRPKGLAVDASDRVFVVDNLEDRVVVLDAAGRYVGSFGLPGSADSELWSPVGIAASGDTVVVADTQNHRLALFALRPEATR